MRHITRTYALSGTPQRYMQCQLHITAHLSGGWSDYTAGTRGSPGLSVWPLPFAHTRGVARCRPALVPHAPLCVCCVYHDAIIPAPTRDGVVIMIYRPEPADAA